MVSRVGGGVAEDGDVEASGMKVVDQGGAELLAEQLQGDPGQVLAHRTGDPWQKVVGRRADEADRDAADEPGLQQADLVLSAVDVGQDATGREAAGAAPAGVSSTRRVERLQQFGADVAFEALDLLGNRRLGQVQRLGRSAEAGALGDRDEGAQGRQIHALRLSIMLIHYWT